MYRRKKVIVISLIVVFAIVVLFLLNYSKDCGADRSCFDQNLAKCSKAKVILLQSGNHQEFEILSSKKESCMVLTTIKQVNPNSPVQVKKYIEGKGMICELPKTIIAGKSITDIPSISDYCTGPLKEALLQITIEKLYELVVQNIGAKALEAHDTTFGTSV